MNITKQIVTSSNWTTGRQGNTVTGIVLHTMVGTTSSAYARFNDPSSQVSVHYGVSLDGSIHQWVEESNTAWQAGNWQVNLNTIGIEHEDNGNSNDSVRTPQLYESSSDLVADICKRYNIPCDTNHIFLHKNVIDKSVYPGGTACPDGLDTNKIISMASAKIGGNVDEIKALQEELAQVTAIANHRLDLETQMFAAAGANAPNQSEEQRTASTIAVIQDLQKRAGKATKLSPGLYEV